MARIPTAGEVLALFQTELTARLSDMDLDEEHLAHARRHGRYVREHLGVVVGALTNTTLPVREALATVLVDIGRQISPPERSVDPYEQALAARRARGTGPTTRTRRRR